MPAIRVRVGASLDANVQTVFRPLVEAAKRARQQVANEMRGLSSESAGAAAKMGGAYRTNFTEVEKAAIRAARTEAKAAQDGAAAQAKAAAYVSRIKDRYFQEEQKRSEQAERANVRASEKVARSQERYAEKQASRTGYWSIRYMDRAMRGAGRLGLDIARGAGVDLSLGGIIGKNVGLQQQATDLSNASFATGAKGSDVRVDPSALLKQAREVADATATDAGDALSGMRAFVSKTGDLVTARDVLGDMAKLAKATGGSMEDYVDAAADVSNNLGDVEDKGKKVNTIMRIFAGQGKAGAVEVRNLASLMARVQAAAGQYGGDATGNFAMIGAMVQEARGKGGAASAREATQSVMTFTNMFSKPRARKRLDAAGIDYENANGSLKSPEEIVVQLLRKASDKKGNLSSGEMGKLVMDANARKATRGFESIYRTAGGGDAGIDAVRAEFKRLRDVAIGQGDIDESFKKAMATSASQVQLFNNALSKIGEEAAGRILPQMQRLAPVILGAVEGLSKFVAWAAENPGKALAAALAASIARAGIETVVRAGIENLIKTGGAGTTGYNRNAGFSGGIGVLGNLGAAITIASAAVTIEQAGELVIDSLMNKRGKGADRSQDLDAEALNAIAKFTQRTGAPSAGDVGELVKARESTAGRLSALKDFQPSPEAELLAVLSGGGAEYQQKKSDLEKSGELQANLDRMNNILANFGKSTLDVRVVNMPANGSPSAPPVDGTSRFGLGLGSNDAL